MQNAKVKFDTSDELIIQACNYGFKLIRPDKLLNQEFTLNENDLLSVKSVSELPICVYFLDRYSRYQRCNESVVECGGFLSMKEALGKGVTDISQKGSETALLTNDQEVINSHSMKILDEAYLRIDDILVRGVSFKFPWYSDDNKILGVMGFTYLTEGPKIHSAANSLSLILKTGLLNPVSTPLNSHSNHAELTLENIHFSAREKECLKLLMYGKTIKAIANILGISNRTVNHYLENIKFKMGVTYKSELIEKLHSLQQDKLGPQKIKIFN
jgi:DNA-binding CsgD family transcriptional regulator